MGGKGQLSFVTSASSPPACMTALIVEAITLSHYCWQSSCSSRETPPMLTPPGHFNCSPQLKVFINFPPSPASSTIRSAARHPDRQSSEEHLQFKRDAYATAVRGLKVNRLLRHPAPPLPCRVSGVFYISLLETLYFLPGLLPTRLAQWLHSPCGVTKQTFPQLPIEQPRERMATTAAVLAGLWQMVLSLFLLISDVMTFPFKNTDVTRAATGAPLWEAHNVCCCFHFPICICSYLWWWLFHVRFYQEAVSRWKLCLALKQICLVTLGGWACIGQAWFFPPVPSTVQGDGWGFSQSG